MSAASGTMQAPRWNKWNFIARLIPAVLLLCAVLDYFFAANFGSRCLDQASRKGSLRSGLLSRQRSAPSTPNIQLACVHQAKPLVRRAPCEPTPSRGVAAAILNPPQNLAQKFQGRLAFLRGRCQVILARPLPHCDANTSTRKD